MGLLETLLIFIGHNHDYQILFLFAETNICLWVC